MYYWNWKKELNQFNYDYNKTMAEMADAPVKTNLGGPLGDDDDE